MTNDPVPHNLFKRAYYAAQLELQKGKRGQVCRLGERQRDESYRAHADDSLAIDLHLQLLPEYLP